MDDGDGTDDAALKEELVRCLAPYCSGGNLSRDQLQSLLRGLLNSLEEAQISRLLDCLVEDCGDGASQVCVHRFAEWFISTDSRARLRTKERFQKAKGTIRKVIAFRTREQSLLLGVSVAFLSKDFLSEVEAHFGVGVDPNYHELNPVMFWGPHARGHNFICPRDGRQGASYVDALPQEHAGPATVMLSWTWSYAARTVVTALAQWCERSQRDPRNTFVWQCALCNNQFRVQEKKQKGENESFDSFRSVFESRVRSTGHILALLSPWHSPLYVKRIWCVFELWVACQRKDVELEVIMSREAQAQFHESLQVDGMSSVWKAFGSVQIQKAKASVATDRKNILHLVEPNASKEEDYDCSEKVQRLNEAVVQRLQAWCADAAAAYVEASLASTQAPQPRACANTAWLLMEAHDWQRAMALLVQGRKALEKADRLGTMDDAWLLKSMGAWYTDLGKYEEGMEHFMMAKNAMRAAKAENTSEYARLLRNIAKAYVRQGHLTSAMGYFQQTQDAFVAAGAANTPHYAVFLRSFGFCRADLGQLEEAMALYEQSKEVFESTDSVRTPNYAGLLMDMGRCRMTEGEYEAALKLYDSSLRAFQLAGAERSRNYADLLHCMGDCLDEQHKHDEALRFFNRSQSVFESCGLAKTTNYAELLANMADCMKKKGLEQDSAVISKKASQIFQAANASADVLETMSPLERRRRRVLDTSRSPVKKEQLSARKTEPSFHLPESHDGGVLDTSRSPTKKEPLSARKTEPAFHLPES